MGAAKIEDAARVRAETKLVWRAIQDPAVHAKWHPFVAKIRGEHRLGAIRECDVKIGTKLGRTEERCTIYEEGRAIMWKIEKDSTGFSRMVSDWEAGFSLEPQGTEATLVIAHSVFRPKKFSVRIMMPFIRHKFHVTQRIILKGLRQYAEETHHE